MVGTLVVDVDVDDVKAELDTTTTWMASPSWIPRLARVTSPGVEDASIVFGGKPNFMSKATCAESRVTSPVARATFSRRSPSVAPSSRPDIV